MTARPPLDRALPALAGLAGLVVYLPTLAPTIVPGDGPELSAAAWVLGVPHPTGYPLYMLLGHAVMHVLPFGDPAFRLNLLSAVAAAAALGAIASLVRRLTGSAAAAWLSAIAFGATPSFWIQATQAEVYTLAVLLLALVLEQVVAWEQGAGPRRLRVAVVLLGVALAHHLTSALLVPGLAVAVLSSPRRPRARELAILASLGAAPLLLYAYLPLAAAGEPAVAWGDTGHLRGIWDHVTGARYRILMGQAELARVPAIVATYASYLARQLGPWLLWLVPLGVLKLARTAPRLLVATMPAYLLTVAFATTYGVLDVSAFLLPSDMILAAFVGVGAASLMDRLPSRGRQVAAAACLALPCVVVAIHLPAQDRHADRRLLDRSRAALAVAPPGATLLTEGDTGYGLLYAQVVEGLRPEVELVDVHLVVRPRYRPELERLRLPPNRWVRSELEVIWTAASLDAGRRPLLIWPGAPDKDWAALGLTRVRRGVVDELVRGTPQPLLAEEGVTLADFGVAALQSVTAPPSSRVGEIMEVRYRWRLDDPAAAAGHTVFAVLADERGEVALDREGQPAHLDRHPLGQGIALHGLPDGAVIEERLRLVVPRELGTGPHRIAVGLDAGSGLVPADPGGALLVEATSVSLAGDP